MRTPMLLRLLRFWPPFLGAGISVRHVSADLRSVDVAMKLTAFNKNYVGVHFGGSLYSMVDPFFMIMMMENLGRQYVVWDKAATIHFKKPARGTVTASFRLSQAQIDAVVAEAHGGAKVEPVYTVDICDASGAVVSIVHKTLYIRRKT